MNLYLSIKNVNGLERKQPNLLPVNAPRTVNPEDAVKLMLKYLGLSDKFPMVGKFTSRTPLHIRDIVWKFWHRESEESTLTTSLARLRVASKPHYHDGLEYASTVQIVLKRKKEFYQSIWKTVSIPYTELYTKYCSETTDHVSWGSFVKLCPFYVRKASDKDLQMCCCKIHLHGRWCITALIKLAGKLNIPFSPTNYDTFFSTLYSDCPSIENTYIPWECTPDKKTVCSDILNNFKSVTENIVAGDVTATVPFTYFDKKVSTNAKGEIVYTKEGKPSKKLVPVKEQANNQFLVQFMAKLLPEIIFHRNMLKLYRSIKDLFLNIMQCAYIDIDFAENLTVGIKWEPQSLHWSKKQVTVHSGIFKYNAEKVYHPYVSDSRIHDQVFVKQVVEEMVDHSKLPDGVNIVLESDNCSSQYKSSQHFSHLQALSNNLNRVVYRIWGIANHGKGEVDHVGGIAKVAVRESINSGAIYDNSEEIVQFLNEKFKHKESPSYHIKEILVDDLMKERNNDRRRIFKRIDGSNGFQVAIFKPSSNTFIASPRLCICDECKVEIGSCSLYSSYEIQVQELNPLFLRNIDEPAPEIVGKEEVSDFITVDSVVAVPAPKGNVNDRIWFIKVV